MPILKAAYCKAGSSFVFPPLISSAKSRLPASIHPHCGKSCRLVATKPRAYGPLRSLPAMAMGLSGAGITTMEVAFIAPVLLTMIAASGVLLVLQLMHRSVGVEKPTQRQLDEENHSSHALFRHIPVLKDRLAWRQLGTFPTPVHRGSCRAQPIGATGQSTNASERVTFYVKREDLSSSDTYGGNKVRTLQHNLAVVEAKLERGSPKQELLVFGTGGSNQVVATIAHALRARIPVATTAVWFADPPDLDNALNMLSALSLPLTNFCTWGTLPASLLLLAKRFITSSAFMLPIGGNNPAGVLGQASGALELAEQVEGGEVPDCDGIYVPVGSSCTISGLIVGVALARRLGLRAYAREGFRLHAVPIHHSAARLSRVANLFKARWSRFIPVTIRHSIHTACAELTRLGGPDVLAEALAVLEEETEVHDAAEVAGQYGVHSDVSRAAARLFDATHELVAHGSPAEGMAGPREPPLWLCGHFAAKAFAVMCDDLLAEAHRGKTMLFWQTKSSLQPRGPRDEWAALQRMPPAVQEWAVRGEAESELRPGKVNLEGGSPADYRKLMTEVSVAPDSTRY